MAEMLWGSQGSYLANPKLNRIMQLSAEPLLRFRQFVSIKGAIGSGEGETVNFTKAFPVSAIGGKIAETSTVPTSTRTLTKGTLTLYSYGNSVPFTKYLKKLSFLGIVEELRRGLLNDSVKVRDGLIEREFNKTALRYVGTATGGYVLTTNGTTTATNSSVLNSYHIRKMALELKKRNIPGYGKLNGDYAGIFSYEATESLRGAMETINSYTETGYKVLLSGEQGRLYGCRIVEDGFATRFTYVDSPPSETAITWTNALSGVGYLFGAPTVMEGVAEEINIVLKEETDYKRSLGMAWLMIVGEKLIWEVSDGAGYATIIKWDSGA